MNFKNLKENRYETNEYFEILNIYRYFLPKQTSWLSVTSDVNLEFSVKSNSRFWIRIPLRFRNINLVPYR